MKNEYNVQKLQKLFQDFYRVTEQAVGLFDAEGRAILEYPGCSSRLCGMVRADAEGMRRCAACSARAIEQAGQKGEPVEYRCHAGLLNICAPLYDDEGVVGYAIFGQNLDDTSREHQWEAISASCDEFVKDRAALRAAFDELRVVTHEYMESVAHILEACIGYIRLERMVKTGKSGLWGSILSYVGRNLTGKISLNTVAEELGVSVSTICRCVKTNADCTLGDLVWHERIELAKQLLCSTELPVMEVAARVGVEDYNYFIRMFRRYCGKSPAVWRREEKKNRAAQG